MEGLLAMADGAAGVRSWRVCGFNCSLDKPAESASVCEAAQSERLNMHHA